MTSDVNVKDHPKKDKKDRQVPIHINGEQFVVTIPVTGAHLRELGRIPDQNQLFLERPGKDPDLLIEAGTSYELKPGSHLYDLPRGTVGAR